MFFLLGRMGVAMVIDYARDCEKLSHYTLDFKPFTPDVQPRFFYKIHRTKSKPGHRMYPQII